MFIGNYSNSIDSKGRCMIPARFRAELGEKAVIVKGFDECIYLYSFEAWIAYADSHINNRPEEDRAARQLKFFFYSNSREMKVDAQGRINLPSDYKEFAGIDKDIVNIGFGERIEIWSKERYEAKIAGVDADPAELLGSMLKYVDVK